MKRKPNTTHGIVCVRILMELFVELEKIPRKLDDIPIVTLCAHLMQCEIIHEKSISVSAKLAGRPTAKSAFAAGGIPTDVLNRLAAYVFKKYPVSGSFIEGILSFWDFAEKIKIPSNILKMEEKGFVKFLTVEELKIINGFVIRKKYEIFQNKNASSFLAYFWNTRSQSINKGVFLLSKKEKKQFLYLIQSEQETPTFGTVFVAYDQSQHISHDDTVENFAYDTVLNFNEEEHQGRTLAIYAQETEEFEFQQALYVGYMDFGGYIQAGKLVLVKQESLGFALLATKNSIPENIIKIVQNTQLQSYK